MKINNHLILKQNRLARSILVNNDIIDEISNVINPQTFYDPSHVKIFEVIENLNNKGMIANPITLKNFLKKKIFLMKSVVQSTWLS